MTGCFPRFSCERRNYKESRIKERKIGMDVHEGIHSVLSEFEARSQVTDQRSHQRSVLQIQVIGVVIKKNKEKGLT